MADHTKIEWTDATWNPITGCSVVSPGCTNCYAMRLAGTRLAHHESRAGLTRDTKAGPVWTGEVRFNEQWIDQPLRWRKPRLIFVCAHGDLFAEGVPDAWIDRVFAVMALAPQHTFQVLTKRSTRMREYMAVNPGFRIRTAMQAIRRQPVIEMDWPLPNVWLGVSVENQKRADERIPDLLATPAAVRWISAEPLLGRMNLRRIRIAPDHHTIIDSLDGYALSDNWSGSGHERTKLDWVVVGGESGPGARPMHPDWAHSLRDQCAAAGVAFHFKQWGEWAPTDGDDPDWFKHSDRDAIHRFEPRGGPYAAKVGKARAGRLLDGVNHDGWPQVRHG